MKEHHQEIFVRWAEAAGLPSSGSRSNKNDVVLELKNGQWLFRLKNPDHDNVLRAKLSGLDTLTIDYIQKSGVYFSTNRLRALSSTDRGLRIECGRLQRETVLLALETAATYQDWVEYASEIVAQLDALASLAHMAANNAQGYCRPILTDGEENGMGIELKGARHPCVELQDKVKFIPNDMHLVFGQSSFNIVTGPNMGGVSFMLALLL
jgi:DNA mismatch repair protein MSH2